MSADLIQSKLTDMVTRTRARNNITLFPKRCSNEAKSSLAKLLVFGVSRIGNALTCDQSSA